MQKQNVWRLIIGLLVMLTVVAVFSMEPAHALPEQKTVRVAYPEQPGFTIVNDLGEYKGYTYEYLEEIAQYTGWKYEFVQVPGTREEQSATLMNMLKNGEIDLMGAVQYSERLDVDYDYSGYSYGTVETVLCVLANKEQDMAMDASRTQTVRVAVQSGMESQIDGLREYCEINRIDPVLVECSGDGEMMDALREGRADALLNTSVDYSSELRAIARFSPRQFYFITGENDPSNVLPELNEAIANLQQTDPYFQVSLHEAYFAPRIYELVLSEEEKAYIQKTGSLKVGVLRNQPPFQYRDKVDGNLKGVGVELLRYISEKTGLQFSMLEADSQEQLYEMAENGKVDLVAGILYNYSISQEHGLYMTRPYVTCPYILLLNDSISEENIRGKRLAMARSSVYHGYFLGKVVYYDTVDDCIRAVSRGEADYTYMNTYAAQYYINLPEFERLKMVPQTYDPYKTCFGITAPADHNLFNILNKAILSIPIEELQSIIYTNTVQKQTFSLGVFIRKNPVQALLAIAGIFLLILLLLLMIFRQRIRAAKGAALELQRHMRLYAVSNDLIFEYDYQKENLMISSPENGEGGPKIQHYEMTEAVRNSQEQKSRDAFLEFLRTQKSGVFEKQLYGSDGVWHWYRIVLEVICGDAGKPVYAIGRLNMIDEERNVKNELLQKAQRDSLTHLYNIESSQGLIEAGLAATKEGEKGALVILDVDCFKTVNDTYGHMCGDGMLRKVARLLQNNFRSEDIVGRQGGDEFIVYMSCIRDREALGEKCAAICRAVRMIEMEPGRHLTISVGAILFTGKQDYIKLYQAADRALYTAKAAGRDCYEIASSISDEKLT